MAETRKRLRGETRISQIRVREPRALRGVAANLQALQQDLEVARGIQSRLLPESPKVPGFDLATYYQPAGEVGGDFYDFLPLPDGTLGLLVADASGKGLAGALLMVEARAILRAVSAATSSPREILAAANRVLLRDLEKGRFVTLLLARLDARARTLVVASAGHTPLLLYRDATRSVSCHQLKGVPLGVASDARFAAALQEETLPLYPADRFLLFSDGANELMNPVREEFGMERLQDRVRADAHLDSVDALQALVSALEIHRAGQEPSDDLTLLTGRLEP
jgi:sigma-B regulation protein RsbU (phosphoserine phosphatase)